MDRTASHASQLACQIGGAFASAGLLGLEALDKWKETRKAAEKNVFFFYYKLGQLIPHPK